MSSSRLAWNVCESCFQNKLIFKKIDYNQPHVYSLLLWNNPFVHYEMHYCHWVVKAYRSFAWQKVQAD